MPSAVPIFLKIADEKQVIYFTWPYIFLLLGILTAKEILMLDSESAFLN